MAFDFPNSPSTGSQYVSPKGLYLYDGTSWTTKGDTQSSSPFTNRFKYRTIYTHDMFREVTKMQAPGEM